MRAPGPWIIGDLQQRRNAAARALNAAPNGIDRIDFALARHCLTRGEGARSALIYTAIGQRLADPDSALEMIEGVENLWREDGDAGQDGAIAPWSRRCSPTAPLWPR